MIRKSNKSWIECLPSSKVESTFVIVSHVLTDVDVAGSSWYRLFGTE